MKKILLILLVWIIGSWLSSCQKGTAGNSPIVTPPPPQPLTHSSIYFWTRDSWVLSNGPLYILINGRTQALNESWGGSGSAGCCYYCGTIQFDLPSGVYLYKTWRAGRDTIRGTADVIYGACNSVELTY